MMLITILTAIHKPQKYITLWVEAALGADEVTAMKASLDAQIAEKITPKSVTKTLG
jgi:hypothetical protein